MATTITRVDRQSAAAQAGIKAGMKLVTVNGQPILDFIDYEALSAAERLTVVVEDGPERRTFQFSKPMEQDLGLELELELYPPERHCANHCIFCFVDQTPPSMRASLYGKDDDWRYSMMFGNYVTLTNVSDADFERLIARQVSPLYISVHATAPDVRARMMGNPRAGRILDQLRRLAQGGIAFHCQIVLCPGYNDGAVLDGSLRDLYALHPAARSVAVVPVGLTQFREGLTDLRLPTQAEAHEVIGQVEAFAQGCRQRGGEHFAYASDEFYQLAGLPYPRYEGGLHTPQLSNGVGLMDSFLGEFDQALEVADPPPTNWRRKVTIATGRSAAATLRRLCQLLMGRFPGLDAQVVQVENHFFGRHITVAGLLTGQDIAKALQGLDLGEEVLISAACVRDGQDIFLDDWTLSDVEAQLGAPVRPTDCDGYTFALAVLGREEG